VQPDVATRSYRVIQDDDETGAFQTGFDVLSGGQSDMLFEYGYDRAAHVSGAVTGTAGGGVIRYGRCDRCRRWCCRWLPAVQAWKIR